MTMDIHEYRALASRKRHKYGAQRTQAPDGTWFASKAECARYLELTLLKRAGKIRDLQIQPRFKLHINGEPVCEYRADFAYQRVNESAMVPGEIVVEDVKGVRTDVYRLKKRLMKVLLGLDVVEVVKGAYRNTEDAPKIKRKAKMVF